MLGNIFVTFVIELIPRAFLTYLFIIFISLPKTILRCPVSRKHGQWEGVSSNFTQTLTEHASIERMQDSAGFHDSSPTEEHLHLTTPEVRRDQRTTTQEKHFQNILQKRRSSHSYRFYRNWNIVESEFSHIFQLRVLALLTLLSG